jgi:hypothetical protein
MESWGESNRTHANRKREESANEQLREQNSTAYKLDDWDREFMAWRDAQAAEAEIDSIIEDVYDMYETRWTDSDETRYFDEVGDTY